jgi:hypothetical protein
MSRLNFPISEHRKIRLSRDVQAELTAIAERVAAEASSAAGQPNGYGTDIQTYTDRARAHVWPQTRAAIRAENKNAYLMGIAGSKGAR